MGKPVYLGKLRLKWCDTCNVPLIGDKCSKCGSTGRKVSITPPGEVRIGYEGDLEVLNNALRRDFGCEINRNVVLFNRVPHRDRMDEVIIAGRVICTLRYDVQDRTYRVSLRMPGAYLLGKCAKKNVVVADDGAINPVLSGKNLMVPGVVSATDGISKGDEVIVKDKSGRVFAVGIAKMSTEEMREFTRGVAVKIRYAEYGDFDSGQDSYISDVIDANIEHLKHIESEAVNFIKSTHEKYALPLAVSFSGGKDSLATLLLAMESGEDFRVFFLDTGIELQETVDYVEYVGKKYGIDVDIISAGNAFWDSLDVFGPPARDYRWCCKVTKLGPTTRYILEKYPEGLLTLIGQRRYESEDRMKKGRIWKNEWVPNQLSASPIQNWTSLEVWLYILWKNAPFNVWYRRGLTRIGCYLCPSSDIADLEIVARYYDGVERWFSYLKRFASEHDIPEEWAENAWRWRHPPKWAGGRSVHREFPRVEFGEGTWAELNVRGEYDFKRAINLLSALPPGTWKVENEHVFVREQFKQEAKSLVVRAIGCVGCGVCLGRCPVNALLLDEENKVVINEDKCVHCLDCLGPCPAENF